MRLRSLRTLAAASLVGLLAVVPAAATMSAAGSAMMAVSIIDTPRPQPKWGYGPATVKVQPGTWVTWSNAGADSHTVTAVDGSFDSDELQPGDGFSWYFDQPGTYVYECTLHPWMQGKVVVGDGVSATPSPTAAPDPSVDPSVGSPDASGTDPTAVDPPSDDQSSRDATTADPSTTDPSQDDGGQ